MVPAKPIRAVPWVLLRPAPLTARPNRWAQCWIGCRRFGAHSPPPSQGGRWGAGHDGLLCGGPPRRHGEGEQDDGAWRGGDPPGTLPATHPMGDGEPDGPRTSRAAGCVRGGGPVPGRGGTSPPPRGRDAAGRAPGVAVFTLRAMLPKYAFQSSSSTRSTARATSRAARITGGGGGGGARTTQPHGQPHTGANTNNPRHSGVPVGKRIDCRQTAMFLRGALSCARVSSKTGRVDLSDYGGV